MDFGFTLGEPFSTVKREKTKKQSVGLTDSRRELLQELKTSLDSGWIPQEVWEEEVKKVMNS